MLYCTVVLLLIIQFYTGHCVQAPVYRYRGTWFESSLSGWTQGAEVEETQGTRAGTNTLHYYALKTPGTTSKQKHDCILMTVVSVASVTQAP